jgi:hypothetical protein
MLVMGDSGLAQGRTCADLVGRTAQGVDPLTCRPRPTLVRLVRLPACTSATLLACTPLEVAEALHRCEGKDLR